MRAIFARFVLVGLIGSGIASAQEALCVCNAIRSYTATGSTCFEITYILAGAEIDGWCTRAPCPPPAGRCESKLWITWERKSPADACCEDAFMSWYVSVDGNTVTGNAQNKFELPEGLIHCGSTLNAGVYAIQPSCAQGNTSIFTMTFQCVDC